MKILGLELSSGLRSAAVLDIGSPEQGPLAPRVLGVARAPTGQTAHPTGLVNRAMAEAAVEREAIEGMVIGLGPGSYTGIRMAIAFAQGWQLARSIQVTGISSADCLAEQLRAAGHRGRVHVAIDAQRNEFCLGQYFITEKVVREERPLALVPAAKLEALQEGGLVLAGPGLSRRLARAIDMDPDAATLGCLTGSHPNWLPAEQLIPIYLRPVQFVRAAPPREDL